MAWIESHQELRDHPKTRRAARALDISVPQMIGHLHLLWWWALDYAESGDLTGYENFEIAASAMWEGDANLFVDTLCKCGKAETVGFLDPVAYPDGKIKLFIRDWDQYAGRLLEQREKNAARQKTFREKRKSSSNSSNADVTDTENESDVTSRTHNGNVTVTSPLRNRATIPYQTKPNIDDDTRESTFSDFEQFLAAFWQHYPYKVGKKQAELIARSIEPRHWSDVVRSVPNYAKSQDVLDGFAKRPENYLLDEAWVDYIDGPVIRRPQNGHNLKGELINGKHQQQPRGQYRTSAEKNADNLREIARRRAERESGERQIEAIDFGESDSPSSARQLATPNRA